MARAVFCTVKITTQASAIVDRLKAVSFLANDISVLAPDKNGTKDFTIDNETKSPEGAAAGATTGAVLGGGLGWLAGIGALAIPGVGPLIAAGPIMAALTKPISNFDRLAPKWRWVKKNCCVTLVAIREKSSFYSYLSTFRLLRNGNCVAFDLRILISVA